jgi:hypothetical protein
MPIPVFRAALLSVLVVCMPALAATAAEEAMFKAPMPHQLLGGHGAKVHLVRLHGYLYAEQGNAAYYRKLKTTGARKTILGLQCEVSDNLLDPGGTICLSLGGSFAGSQVAHMSDHSGMMLEMTSQVWETHNAVEALLDADVDGAVFGPYLSGGYQIQDRGVRK